MMLPEHRVASTAPLRRSRAGAPATTRSRRAARARSKPATHSPTRRRPAARRAGKDALGWEQRTALRLCQLPPSLDAARGRIRRGLAPTHRLEIEAGQQLQVVVDAQSARAPVGPVRQSRQHQQRIPRPDPLIQGAHFGNPERCCHRHGHDQQVAGGRQLAPLRQSIEALAQRDGADAFRGEPDHCPKQSVAMALDGGGQRDPARARPFTAHEQRGEYQQGAERAGQGDQPLAHTLTSRLAGAASPAPPAARVRAPAPRPACAAPFPGPRNAPTRRPRPTP